MFVAVSTKRTFAPRISALLPYSIFCSAKTFKAPAKQIAASAIATVRVLTLIF
jgi:hypothetical protein